MKLSIKKCLAGVLAGTMLFAQSVPAMAETEAPKVFVNFICAGQITGQFVPAGSNVTAPAVPYRAGYTFCGFDKSLNNVTANTTYTAVYVSNDLGENVINATKASLPAPAVTATTVAAPAAVQIPAVAPAAPAAQATPATAPAPAAQTDSAAQFAAAQAAQLAQAQALLAKLQAAAQASQSPAIEQAAQAVVTQGTAAVQNAQAALAQNPEAVAKAVQAAQAAAPAAAAAIQAVPAAIQATPGVPSWVVGLEGVDAAGAANAYNYLKNTKGLDDASIQANWGAFMHHYAGHGVAGW